MRASFGVWDAGEPKVVGVPREVVALVSADVETPQTVAERLRRALPHKDASQLIAAPDCGMKYLPRDVALAKLRALVNGAAQVRDRLAS